MKLMKSTINGLCLLLLFMTSIAHAQEQPVLEKAELLRMALEKSHTVQNQQIEVSKADLLRKKASHAYLPKVNLLSSVSMVHTKMSMPKVESGFGLTPENIGALKQVFGPFLMTLTPEQQQTLGGFQEKLQQYKQMDEMEFEFTQPLYTVGVTAYMPVFTGFKISNLKKAASYKVAAQEEMLHKSEAEVIKEFSDYYDRLALISQSQKVLEESKLRLEQEKRTAKRAFQEGLITRYDFDKIDIASLELESKYVELEGKKALLAQKLEQLTGMSSATFGSLAPELKPWLLDKQEATVAERPEAKAMNLAIDAREAKLKAAYSGYMPTVAAFGSANYIKTGGVEVKPMALAGVAVSWNIFDGLHTAHEVEEAKLELQQEENRKEEVMEMLQLGWQKAKVDFEVSGKQFQLATQKAKHALKAAQIASRQYQEGLIKVSERLEAEADLQKAKLEELQAVYTQRIAALKLLEANGSLNSEFMNTIKFD